MFHYLGVVTVNCWCLSRDHETAKNLRAEDLRNPEAENMIWVPQFCKERIPKNKYMNLRLEAKLCKNKLMRTEIKVYQHQFCQKRTFLSVLAHSLTYWQQLARVIHLLVQMFCKAFSVSVPVPVFHYIWTLASWNIWVSLLCSSWTQKKKRKRTNLIVLGVG